VGPRAGLNAAEKRKILPLVQGRRIIFISMFNVFLPIFNFGSFLKNPAGGGVDCLR
jgi:hypothetical protein